jgi:hypothetical protein
MQQRSTRLFGLELKSGIIFFTTYQSDEHESLFSRMAQVGEA